MPCGPVNDLAAAVQLAADLGLEPVVEIRDPQRGTPSRQITHPARYPATPARYDLAPPSLPS